MTGNGLLGKTFRDQRGTIIGMGLANVLLAVLMLLLYPSVAEQYAELDLPDFYDVFFGEASIAEPEGFLAAEYFSWIPAIIIVFAVIAGTASIAGEEGEGTLELLLAAPITRRAVLLRKAVALGLALGLVSVLAFPGIVIGTLLVEFDLGYGRMVEATLLMVAHVWFFLAFSILASAALPARSHAVITVTTLAVLAYFANVVAALAPGLQWLANVNPFGWADYPAVLLHGTQWLEMVLLLGFAGLFVLLAMWFFERRDIGAATWPTLRRHTSAATAKQPGGEARRNA